MTSVFPTVPRVVFTILEPLSLVAGSVAPFISPEWFIAEQVVSTPIADITQGARMIAYQLGNIYLLMAMVGVVILYTTTEAKVVRNYIIALWLADMGHVAITCYIMEYKRVINVTAWNAMAWGNIGATTLLFIFRSAYLLGLFGPDRVPASMAKEIKLQ